MGVRNDASTQPPVAPQSEGGVRAAPGLSPEKHVPSGDGVDAPRAHPDAGVAAASPRRTIGQRLGSMAKGLLKGAAVVGLAAGLVVGGLYFVDQNKAPTAPQEIEQTVTPGGVHDPSLPGGQGPPAVEVDAPTGTHRSPTLPTEGTSDTGTTETAPGGLPSPGGPAVTFDPGAVVKPLIPADGGQRLQDAIKPADETTPGVIHSPLRGVPGVGQDTGQLDPLLQKPDLKPALTIHRTPDAGGPDLTTDASKPALQGQGTTTDTTKPTLQNSGGLGQVQIDSTRLPSFRPHQIRGQ